MIRNKCGRYFLLFQKLLKLKIENRSKDFFFNIKNSKEKGYYTQIKICFVI